jgi:hypothetical protein
MIRDDNLKAASSPIAKDTSIVEDNSQPTSHEQDDPKVQKREYMLVMPKLLP